MHSGWAQVAFDEDLHEDVVPVDLAGRALVAVRRSGDYEVYDARCPHRGAHLGHGGRLEGDVLTCPFHGHRVQLVADMAGQDPSRFCVGRHRSAHAAGGLFVLMDDRHDTGLGERLAQINESHYVRPAFTRDIAVPPEFVIENVLDADHFVQVHALSRRPELEVHETGSGSLEVLGHLEMERPNQWQSPQEGDDPIRTRFSAQVYSPTLVVTELVSGDDTNVVITAATPTTDGGCTARVTVALPRVTSTGAPTVRQMSSLISGSQTAFDQDVRVWEHLDPTFPPHYLPGDRLVRTYRDFCDRFNSP